MGQASPIAPPNTFCGIPIRVSQDVPKGQIFLIQDDKGEKVYLVGSDTTFARSMQGPPKPIPKTLTIAPPKPPRRGIDFSL